MFYEFYKNAVSNQGLPSFELLYNIAGLFLWTEFEIRLLAEKWVNFISLIIYDWLCQDYPDLYYFHVRW